jgi:hypothetical protein
MSGEARVAAPDKSPDRIAGMFERNRAALRPAQPAAQRRHRSLVAQTRHRLARTHGTRGAGRRRPPGTADVALEACAPRRGAARAARVVGVDFARAMLVLGVDKVKAAGESGRVVLVHGDAMRLPVASGTADAVTIAFGIRNVQAASVACAEMAPRAQARRPAGHPGVRDPALARPEWAVSVVLQGGAAAGGPDDLRPQRRLLVSAGLGRHLSRRPAEFSRMLESGGVRIRCAPTL